MIRNLIERFFKKPYRHFTLTRQEQYRRAKIIQEGMKSEFWQIMRTEIDRIIQNECIFITKELYRGNDDAAKRSASFVEALEKIVNMPHIITTSNVDLLEENKQEELKEAKEKEDKNARTSRFTTPTFINQKT